MTRPSTPPILSELRSSSSPASQVAALRALKNDIIGHEQKKEMWIGLGVLAPIARILNSPNSSGKKRNYELHGSNFQSKRNDSRTDEEEALLQAIIIIGSLALGGPAYVPPLNAGLVITPLLAVLSPSEFCPPAVLAALRTLNSVADSLSLEQPSEYSNQNGLHCLLYTEKHLTSITELLSQASSSAIVQQQISLAAALITKTCHNDVQRKMLAQMGVLEALATRLSSFVVATGCSLGPQNRYVLNSAYSDNPSAATIRSRLAPILEAISTIIENSKSWAMQFLSAPAFASVFRKSDADSVPIFERRTHARNSPLFNPSTNRLAVQNPIETLLPQLPSLHHRGSTAQLSNFPPLGAIGTAGKQPQISKTFSSAIEEIQSQAFDYLEDDENPLISWLIFITRAEGGITRLMAASILAIFYRFGLTNKRRETGFAFLLVPLLVQMLDKDSKSPSGITSTYDANILRSPDWIVKEQAPAVLAMLAVDSLELQRATVDAGAIRKLSQLLKESYDPLPKSSSTSIWTPQPANLENPESKANASKLAAAGLSPMAYHVMKMREAVLIALAAIASLKDEYRKAIIDNGVVPFVIESLKLSSPISSLNIPKSQTEESQTRKTLRENPNTVILAACGAARALSRSVSTLRTSLMDAGLAAPLFVLLRHQDMEIQIAATAVICNLVLEFSPMREAIIDAGILKLLCEHAHSVNSGLRLNSVWALKHLMMTAPNSLKMKCLEELGPGWLKQIISNDTEELAFTSGFRGDKDIGLGTPIAMGTPNAAGEQVDLLNAVEDNSRGSIQTYEEDGEEDLKMTDSNRGLSRPESDYKQSSRFSRRGNGRVAFSETSRLSRGKEDISLTNQARTEQFAVQKEGLELVRNLTCGPGAPDMIDYIFRELGQDKTFDMLAGKLRPKMTNAFNRDKRSSENCMRYIQPQPEIITAVCYIIIHIAASNPKHRQLLISQPELLKLLIPLFNHSQREVRSCCAWIVINLTWVDDQSDHSNCKIRARELLRLGVYEKLEDLVSDPELDVRERTKTAIHQMSELLK